jgi:Tfp pilus assembly protein PilE
LSVRLRGAAYIELLVVLALIMLLATLVIIPSYRQYVASRQVHDAATTLAEDMALLERSAQNGARDEGATLWLTSGNPLTYSCYRGRPESLDPNSHLQGLIVRRTFPHVALLAGPVNASSPLLFAGNGSAQYQVDGAMADSHEVVDFSLGPADGTKQTAHVILNPFTGSISQP